MIGSEDPGQKPAVPNYMSDGHGGRNSLDNDNDFDGGSRADEPRERVSLSSARGGQTSPRSVFKATEKRNTPVVPDSGPSTTGWVRGEDHAKDPTIPS